MILWFVILLLAVAVTVSLLSRFPLTAALLSTTTLLVTAVSLAITREVPDLLLVGRRVTLLPGARMGLAFCLALLALVMLHTYRVPQGEFSYALTLGAAGFFAASLIVHSNTLKVLTLEIGAIVALALLPVREQRDAVLGARALVLIALAGMLLLVGAWTLEIYAPELEVTAMLQLSTAVTMMGFLLLLGVGPFGLWLTPLFRRGAYLAGIMLHIVLGGALLFFLSGVFREETYAGAQELIHILLLVGGVGTCLLGGMGAMAQRSVSGALSYSALADLGVVLTALGLGSSESATVGIMHFMYRAVGIVVVAMVAGLLRHHFGGDDHEHLAGIWQRAPLLVMALATGGLSLAGLPPLAGFGTRLNLYQMLAMEHAAWMPALLISSLGPAWAFGRCTLATLSPPLVSRGGPSPRYPGLLPLFLGLSLLALGISPHLLTRLPSAWIELLAAASAFVP
ncbi:MAG: proton-conducting transporter membrane subunit [Anaerolineales bacterium]